MPKKEKIFSSRYIKSKFYHLLTKSDIIANALSLYDKAIDYREIQGTTLLEISDEMGVSLCAKEFENILLSEKTGASLYKSDKIYKVISGHTGLALRNWVRPSFGKKNIINLEGTAINLIGVHKGIKHFFHFFFDYVIPILIFLRSEKYDGRKISIVVRADQTEFQRETYKLIEQNFPNIKFVTLPKNSFVNCEKLIYIYHAEPICDYNRGRKVQLKDAMHFLRDGFVKLYNITEKKEKDLIYISRRKAKLRRTLNETEITKYLNEKGFKSVLLEDLSLRDQIESFYNAKFIFATHGAGFGNLLFANDDLQFMEVYSKKFYGPDFLRISKLLGLTRYEYIEDNEQKWQCFYLDVAKITPQIDKILLELN